MTPTDKPEGTAMTALARIDATLPAELVEALEESVREGEHPSTDAALREAVALWRKRRREDAETLANIKACIRRSIDDPRPDVSEEEVDAELEKVFEAARREFPSL
jgi:antitoxin ParD1/3/4